MADSLRASARRSRLPYVMVVVLAAVATVAILMLLDALGRRTPEARAPSLGIVELTEQTLDPAEWGKNYPLQYDSYRRTVDVERTRHGGSEAFQKLDEDPLWRELFAGFAFGIDYREERGHAYMLQDQRETERVTRVKQPGACLHCHASDLPVYRRIGVEHGAPGDLDLPLDHAYARVQLMRGFEVVCALPYAEATKLVEHPITCLDCHDPRSLQLRVTRPAFFRGIAALARSEEALPHLPSIERWRRGDRAEPYDPNRLASRQELRSLVCAQCHAEYYFRGPETLVVYPWDRGLSAEAIEEYYDEYAAVDWTHLRSRTPLLKAQHPEFELWSQGTHARAGVACADCHMPRVQEGAVTVSDHHVRSPLLNIRRACQSCHDADEAELEARAVAIQDKTQEVMLRAESATVALIAAIEAAMDAGFGDERLDAPRRLHRRAQWRLDFVASGSSMGFHAAQEAARLLAEAIDFARQGEIRVLRARLAGDRE